MEKFRKNENYGWFVCVACTLLMFCTNGLSLAGFSAYQPYLISIGGLTNTEASTVVTFRTLFTLIAMLITTPLIKKVNVRKMSAIGMLLCALAFGLYGFAESFIGYAAAASVCGLAAGLGGTIPVSIVIARWFNGHRGLALGICMAATGFSTIVASPLITIAVQRLSLSAAFYAEAVFILISGVIVYNILRNSPYNMGLEPIGAHETGRRPAYAVHKAPSGLYMAMMIGIFIFGMPGNVLYTHISVLYRTAGFESMQISWLLSIFGFMLMTGKCVYGQIADRFGTWHSSWLLYALLVIGTVLCCFADNGSFVNASFGVALMGFGLAVTAVSISMYAAGVSTEEQYSATLTRFQVLSTVGSLVFSTVPGIIADKTGSYVPAFVIMLVLAVIGGLVLQFSYHRIRVIDTTT